MFSNPFYTWKFMWLWELRNGNHKAMITFKEYQYVQKLLGKKWRTICAKIKEFSYTWMIQCWECGWSITATEKIKKIKTTWEIKNYIYYHCTKKKIWNNCKQKPIRIEDLEEQINIVLDSIEIIPEFKQWWLDLLKKDYNIQVEQNKKIQASIRKKISENEIRLHRLTDLLLDESIDKKEYNIRKSWLRIGLIELSESLQNNVNGTNDSTDLTERLFDIIINIQEKFNTWTLLDKKTLFSCLGENSVLLDWVLAIWTHPWIKPIENKLPNIKRNYDRLELTKKGISFSETNTLNGVIWEWYSHGELNSGPSLEKAVS
jgi:site-specific DNA recombinase